jgi:hypothetical protein
MGGRPPRRGCRRGLGPPGSGSGGKLSFVGLEGWRPWSRSCGVVTPRLKGVPPPGQASWPPAWLSDGGLWYGGEWRVYRRRLTWARGDVGGSFLCMGCWSLAGTWPWPWTWRHLELFVGHWRGNGWIPYHQFVGSWSLGWLWVRHPLDSSGWRVWWRWPTGLGSGN